MVWKSFQKIFKSYKIYLIWVKRKVKFKFETHISLPNAQSYPAVSKLLIN